MRLVFEVTHIMYRATSLFSLVTTSREDILALGNSSKDRETWKGKCEAMKHMRYVLQPKFVALQEKTKLVDSLQEEDKLHGPPSTLDNGITKNWRLLLRWRRSSVKMLSMLLVI